MLRDIVKQRLVLSGFSQNELAELVGCTPAQISLYLSGKSSLNNELLEKILHQLDINLNVYSNRLDLAKRVAEELVGKKSPAEVVYLSKTEMIQLSGIKEVKYLVDVKSAEEFNEAVNSGLIDADNYYVHFRMIVAHILQLKEGEITAKRSRQSVTQLNKTTGAVVLGALAAIGAGVLIALTQKATGIAGRQTGLFSSFTALASNSLINKIK
ncbi:MAG: helix-turn-helix transcriptional regulator [Bacteroidaceae bacterium]|nr:helix-turn-helix transcriptional regulator [Bacteroidaceae bacterium]